MEKPKSELIDKMVKVVFEDTTGTRIFTGILKEISVSHISIESDGKLQAFLAGRVVRIEVIEGGIK
jgi:hypothetical protein